LSISPDRRAWACAERHSFDVAREGYVNLMLAGQRRSRTPGDSAEMVAARRRFLKTGAFDPLTRALVEAVAEHAPRALLDVGCGEGRHTMRVAAPLVLGLDVARPAVAAAARAHPAGWYAVATARDLPLADAAVDVALSVFGPVVPSELARVVRVGGAVIAAHPGPDHLGELRSLVYVEPRPHEVKPPLRGARQWFVETDSISLRFRLVARDRDELGDLFTMTPYRWHAPLDIEERLAAASSGGFSTVANVFLTTYRRTAR